MKLDPEDHRAIAAEVVALIRETPTLTSHIMTRDEAKAYVKRPSQGAFCEWCQKYHVKPYHRGRYSKAQLDAALSLEARKRAA